MKIQEHPLYGGTIKTLLELLGVNDKEELITVIKGGYRVFIILKKDGKPRIVEAPNKLLKKNLRKLAKILQLLDCPEYNFCGWKKQNTLMNVKRHLNANAYLTADISKYYPNTKVKYVREFFAIFNTDEETLDMLVKLTTFRNHLPTGAPTSSILVFLSHQELFDEINAKMQEEEITFSLYADDMTFSSKHGITNQKLRYVRSILAKHHLQAKPEKSKHYSYQKANIIIAKWQNRCSLQSKT